MLLYKRHYRQVESTRNPLLLIDIKLLKENFQFRWDGAV
ncbi:hypothetical protein NIIg32_gp31 [Parageobacillus phage vB_PtoS_NIIg3.2]|nr:hypothetical protein NIIg32_gp31 [Parageobacillus phage vB_PtoS_NIIg3.2]